MSFRHHVATRPDHPAVVDGPAEVTYAELDRWAAAVAGRLRAHGVRAGDRVALRGAPRAATVAAVLGILRVGAAYVPLDLRNPRARNESIFRQARPRAAVADDERDLPDDVPVVRVPERGSEGAGADDAVSLDTTAYVIFTSGTTGEPKGVPITHGNVAALIDGALPAVDVMSSDRWSWFHSIAFDFSVWELWGALASGGTVVVVPALTARDPDAFLDLVAAQGVTVMSQTPTAFGALVRTLGRRADDPTETLRTIVFGGERLTPGLLSAWARHVALDRVALANLYGITEVTVHATFHRVTDDDLVDGRSHIGRPLPGFRSLVVDERGRPCTAPGEVGELLLGGPQVTEGYLGRPDLTAERFPVVEVDGHPVRCYRTGDLVEVVGDGGLAYVGRKDLQVKLRGHRIELGDVEAVVRAVPGVVDAVALVREHRDGDARLVCAYVATDPTGMDDRSLRKEVAATLPSYMVPARFRHVDRLPTTVNGKVDRRRAAELWESNQR